MVRTILYGLDQRGHPGLYIPDHGNKKESAEDFWRSFSLLIQLMPFLLSSCTNVCSKHGDAAAILRIIDNQQKNTGQNTESVERY